MVRRVSRLRTGSAMRRTSPASIIPRVRSGERLRYVARLQLICGHKTVRLPVRQIAVDGSDGPGALADGRSAALDRPRPDVTCGEYTGEARFHWIGSPVENPAVGRFVILQQIR